MNNLFLSNPGLAAPPASPAVVPVAPSAAGASAIAGTSPVGVVVAALVVAAAAVLSAIAGAGSGAAFALDVEAAGVLELVAVPAAAAGAPVIRAAFFFSVSSILSNLSFRSVPCCLTMFTSWATSSLRLATSSFTAFGLKPRSAMANAFFFADSAAAAMASGLPSSRAGLSSSSSSSSSLLSLLSPSILLFSGLDRRAIVGISNGIKKRSANALNTVRKPQAALPRRAKVKIMRNSPNAPPAARGAWPIICPFIGPPICPPKGFCGYGWGAPAYCGGGICAGGYGPIGGAIAPMYGCVGTVLDGTPCSGVFDMPGAARRVRRLGGARGLSPGG